VVLDAPSALPATWTLLFTLPYGDTPDRLGTSLGGDGGEGDGSGEGIQWGPSYGTQLPDGTWWFLDAARLRLAHFGETGDYLGEVPLPAEHLAQGQYFQYQGPLALADGTLVLQGTSIDSRALLRLSPSGALARVPLAGDAFALTTDGTALSGFDANGAPARIDPATGAVSPASAFVGQGGAEFSVEVATGSLRVTRPGLDVTWPVTSASRPDAVVHPRVEAAMGSDGVLTILVMAFVEVGDAVEDAVGVVRVDAAGRGTVEPVRATTSDSDPGDGSHLGVRLGDDRPWLMFIDTDGVRVFRRG